MSGTAARRTTVDLTWVEGLPRRCPGCGSARLEPGRGGERATVGCARCGGSWVVELGYLVPVEDRGDPGARPVGAGRAAGA